MFKVPKGYDAATTSCVEVVSGKGIMGQLQLGCVDKKGIGKRLALIASSQALELCWFYNTLKTKRSDFLNLGTALKRIVE